MRADDKKTTRQSRHYQQRNLMYNSEDSLSIRKILIATKPQDLEVEKFVKLYQPLLESVLNAEDTDSRTTATDTLSVWLLRASQCQQDDHNQISKLVTDEDAHKIVDYVINFWIDSGAALGNAIKDLFRKAINLLSKVRHDKRILYEWTDRAMKLPKNMRVHYFMIETLAKHVGGAYILEKDPQYPAEVLQYIPTFALANYISKTLFAIFNSLYRNMEFEEWVELWAVPVRLALQYPDRRQSLLWYFLTTILKSSPRSFPQFIEPLRHTNTDDGLSVLISCLKLGLNLNIDVHKTVDDDLVEKLLCHSSKTLRLGGLSLLVSSPQGSRPVDMYVYDMFMDNIDSLLVDQDVGYRSQVIEMVRQFVFRVRTNAYAFSRDMRRKGVDLQENLSRISVFMKQLLEHVKFNLQPGTPYHCAVTAVHLLQILVESGVDDTVDSKLFSRGHVPFPFRLTLLDDDIVGLLIDNMVNNYEEVRSLSSKLLRLAPLPLATFTTTRQVDQLACKAKRVASGMRGKEGEGGGRILELVHRLYQGDGPYFLDTLLDDIEQSLDMAEKDMAKAVRGYPVHGYFAGLRYIYQYKPYASLEFVQRLTGMCHRVWTIVKPILCHDSPEGNVPEQLEGAYDPELEKRFGPASQVISSYSWRAVKDVALLFRSFSDNLSEAVLHDEALVRIGDLLITELTTVRHKGVFASVQSAFAACCRACYRRDSLKAKPAEWLDDNIDSIKAHAQYITRRSGGIPFVIVGVLVASRNTQELVDMTFTKLLETAKEPVKPSETKTDLPQVHAFNCIKTLFTESELSKYVTPLVDRALELAINSFGNEVWAIRNCSIMLYTALQVRIFGKTGAKTSARLFFTKYKQVREVLLDNLNKHVSHLDESQSESHVESVYPVLAVLERLQSVDGYQGLDDFKPLVMHCLNSRVWKVREIAARTLPSLVHNSHVDEFALELLESMSISRQNELHGKCLALQQLDPKPGQQVLESRFDDFMRQNPSPQTALAYLRVMKQLCPESQVLKDFCANFGLPDVELSSSHRMLKQEVAKFLLQAPEQLTVDKLLFDDAYEVQQETIAHIAESVSSTESAELLWQVITQADWDQVKGPALRAFAATCDKIVSTDPARFWDSLFEDTKNTNPEINEPSAEILGMVAARLPDKFADWFQLVKEYGSKWNPYPPRFSALKSIAAYMRRQSASVDVKMELWYFLSDDDPELREYASEFICDLFNYGKCALPHTQEIFLQHIVSLPDGYSAIRHEFMGRTSLKDQLNHALKDDELLFTTEEPNVYRNDLAIMDRLYRVLAERHPDQEFEQWAKGGVACLNLAKLDQGPLQKQSQPRVHHVVSKIRYGAKLCALHCT